MRSRPDWSLQDKWFDCGQVNPSNTPSLALRIILWLFHFVLHVLKTGDSCYPNRGGLSCPTSCKCGPHDTGHEVIKQNHLELLVPGRMFNGVMQEVWNTEFSAHILSWKRLFPPNEVLNSLSLARFTTNADSSKKKTPSLPQRIQGAIRLGKRAVTLLSPFLCSQGKQRA